MKLKSNLFPLVIIGIFFGIIGLGMLTGVWQTKVNATDVTVESSEDIKGWMTLEDVSGYLNLSVKDVTSILGLPSDIDSHKPLKEIAADNGKETDDYKELLASHLGEESAPETGEPESQPAQSVTTPPDTVEQTQQPDKTAPSSAAAGAKDVSSGEAPNPEPSSAQTPKENGSDAEEEIKGRMTLKEVEVVTKVPAEYICQKLGIPNNVSRDVPLRELAEQYNFEVDDVKGIAASYDE